MAHARRQPDPAFRPDDTPDLDPTPQARRAGRAGGAVVAFRAVGAPAQVTRPARTPKKPTRKLKNLWRRKDAAGNFVGPYIIRARVRGRWLNESTGVETQREAEAIRDRQIKAARETGAGLVNGDNTVAQWWEVYKTTYLVKMKPSNRQSYLSAIEPFVDAFGGRRMTSLTADESEQYLNQLGASLKPGTVGLYRTKLKAFFGKAVKTKRLHENVWKETTPCKGDPRETILDECDQARYLACLNEADQRFVLTVLETGLRHAEIDQLTPRAVQPDHITVRWQTAKRGKTRIIPIQPQTYLTIEAQRQARGLSPDSTSRLWETSHAGASMNTRERRRRLRFQGRTRKAGLDHITFHDLRRTYGTRCALNNVPVKTLMLWMGHENIETTMRYYIVADALRSVPVVMQVRFARPTLPEGK